MQSRFLHTTLISAFSFVCVSSSIRADVKLPAILGSHMVLQRNVDVPIWGWADAGEKVSVSFAGQEAATAAGKDGKWQISLKAMKANAKGSILTVAGNNTIKLEDVLVGEVWLCSGQSNMEWPVRQSDNAQAEIASAKHPRLRHIKIPHRPSDKPESDVPSNGWQICTPATVGAFTAAGYFFGRELMNELDVPIGLIGSNWGGTRIEPWTPPVGFKKVPALKNIADKLAEYPQKVPVLNKEKKPVIGKDGKPQTRINHQSPLALYNGMIHPLVPFAFRGAIWYQGESNNGEGMLYFEKMKALIEGWRSVWKNPEMPFLYVQLAPYRYGGDPTRLAGIWEAQSRTLSLPNTGMAVTTDIGNTRNIHPTNKQEVGRRLALWALAKTYGEKDLVYSGPLYRSQEIKGAQVTLQFDHTAKGLKSRDGKALNHFQIAGADKKFVKADARIEGKMVIVSSSEVAAPKAVRFGWHQEAEPNLANSEGLPASPFRTDKW